jgi:hypothetical protein
MCLIREEDPHIRLYNFNAFYIIARTLIFLILKICIDDHSAQTDESPFERFERKNHPRRIV